MSATAEQTRLIPRHRVAAFFLLVMAIGGGIVVVVLQAGLPPALALTSGLSASIAGIMLTALEEGRAGLKRMLKRLLIWRVGIGYWIFALFFPVPAVYVGFQANPLFGSRALAVSDLVPGLDIIPIFILFFFIAGLGQELGWSGYLLPRLQARHSALTSSAIRALLAGIWHLPLLLYASLDPASLAGFPYPDWIAQDGLFVTLAVMILVLLLPWAILFAWIFNSTGGSLLLVAVLHASEVWLAYLLVNAGLDPGNLNNYWGYAAVLVATAVAIVIATGPQTLSRNRARIAYPQSQHDHDTVQKSNSGAQPGGMR
jgi:membrane protease YdiL (CAAX protease family)